MRRLNLDELPLVASANASAEASGVWMLGRAEVSTVPTSRARRSRSRFSLRVYNPEETDVKTPVTTSPTARTTTAVQNGHRPRPCSSASAAARCDRSTSSGPRPSTAAIIALPGYLLAVTRCAIEVDPARRQVGTDRPAAVYVGSL